MAFDHPIDKTRARKKPEKKDELFRPDKQDHRRPGLKPDPRKFTPHVTLARFRHGVPGAIADWLTDHARYDSGEFAVRAFHLYSSLMTSDGSIYRIEADYPLKDMR